MSNVGLTTANLLWLAGFLEGEGSFEMGRVDRKAGKTRRPRISFGTTDLDVAQQAAAILQVKVHRRKVRHGNKPMFVAMTWGHTAAGWMMTLYTLMGKRRRTKIREILTAWRVQSTQPARVWAGSVRCAVVRAHHASQPTYIHLPACGI